LLIVPRLSNEPVLHDDARPLMARTRPVPGAATIAAALALALVRYPRRTLGAFWHLRRSRPRRRVFFNALATAEGIWLAGVARAWRADHIHAHWAHLTATLAMGASAVSGIPWSFTAHRYDVVRNNLLAEKLQSARFARFIARGMLDFARSLVSTGAIEHARVLHMGVWLPPVPDNVRPAGVAPIVICPARFVPVKGHGHLLDAAARLMRRGVDFELWLAGDGPLAPLIGRRIDELALGDRVHMLGTIPHAELLRLYRDRAVDCVVLPSLDLGGGLHEGISVALMEAMAHGIPVISTLTGGLPELLEGGAGVLVPPADSGALAEALERVLGSVTLRAELARAGRERVAEEFDVAAIAGELVKRFAGRAAADGERAPIAVTATAEGRAR
jgi:glycosyltransferase involved in cell wall biosynthesis